MKFFLCIFFFGIYSAHVFGQSPIEHEVDSITPNFQLINTNGSNKPTKIIREGYLEFIQLETVNANEDSLILQEHRITGQVSYLSLDTIRVKTTQSVLRKFNQYDVFYEENKSILGGSYDMQLNLSKIDGVYYSSPLKIKLRNATMTMMGMSLFTALVMAPLLSLEYKSYGVGTPGGFDRKQYFAIAGTSFFTASLSFGLYIAFKPRYYSFAYDDFNPKRKRWTIGRVN